MGVFRRRPEPGDELEPEEYGEEWFNEAFRLMPPLPDATVGTTSPAGSQERPAQRAERIQTPRPQGGLSMATIESSLSELLQIPGATGAAIVDADSGMALGSAGNPPFSLEYAAAGNSEVVKAKLRTMGSLGIDESIEDILITLTSQYHLIRVLEGTGPSTLFIYVALDRATANLALARHKVASVSSQLEI